MKILSFTFVLVCGWLFVLVCATGCVPDHHYNKVQRDLNQQKVKNEKLEARIAELDTLDEDIRKQAEAEENKKRGFVPENEVLVRLGNILAISATPNGSIVRVGSNDIKVLETPKEVQQIMDDAKKPTALVKKSFVTLHLNRNE